MRLWDKGSGARRMGCHIGVSRMSFLCHEFRRLRDADQLMAALNLIRFRISTEIFESRVQGLD
jgi:hypothetical protein